MSWPRAVRASAETVRGRPGLIAVGLAGFLARGGLLLFALPFVALPTPVGVANWIGPASITASGPSERLLLLIGIASGLVAAGLAAGTVIGAAADVALFRVAAGSGPPVRRPASRLGPAVLLMRLVIIRLLALAPLALALTWSAQRFGMATYRELILPDELVTPLVLRVLDRTRDAVAVVVGAWLLGEFIGGIAVRHHLLRGDPVAIALLRPLADLLRRPTSTLATFVAGLLPLLALVPSLAVAWFLFGGVRHALAEGGPMLVFFSTLNFVGIWAVGLAVAGAVATWRGLLVSLDVLRSVRPAPEGALPIPRAAEA